MIEATSCGGVVIYRGKILALYKSYKNRYEGWVLPKGTDRGEGLPGISGTTESGALGQTAQRLSITVQILCMEDVQ